VECTLYVKRFLSKTNKISVESSLELGSIFIQIQFAGRRSEKNCYQILVALLSVMDEGKNLQEHCQIFFTCIFFFQDLLSHFRDLKQHYLGIAHE
jgi:hypothetical protein